MGRASTLRVGRVRRQPRSPTPPPAVARCHLPSQRGAGQSRGPAPPSGFDSPPALLLPRRRRTVGLNGGRGGPKPNTWGAGPRRVGGHVRLALPRAWRPRGRALLSPLPALRVRALPGAGRAPRPPGGPGSGRGGARAGGDAAARGAGRGGRGASPGSTRQFPSSR